jgi:glycogen(starch) synthase
MAAAGARGADDSGGFHDCGRVLTMRIGHVLATTDTIGGVWTYSIDLATGFAARGIRTTLVSLNPAPSAEQRAQALAIPGLELVETDLPLDWTAATAAALAAAAAALGAIAKRYDPDIVHLHSPAFATGRPYSCPVVGVMHSCLATWWGAVRRGPLPADFAWRSRVVRQGLLSCDAVIAPTSSFAQAVARAYGIASPIAVPNGRAPAPSSGALRQRAVVTAGRLWDEGKNVACLDQAAALIDAPVLAAGPLSGPGGSKTVLHHARAEGTLSSANTRLLFERSEVFASAALYEPFGLAVLEAALAGCALVLSDIPTFRELWDGVAHFVSPDDPRRFAAAMQRLLDDPREAGEAARRRAASRTLDAMCEGTLRAYGNAVTNSMSGVLA